VHSHYIQKVNRKEIMFTCIIRGVCGVRVVVVVVVVNLNMTDNRNTYPSKTVMRKVM